MRNSTITKSAIIETLNESGEIRIFDFCAETQDGIVTVSKDGKISDGQNYNYSNPTKADLITLLHDAAKYN